MNQRIDPSWVRRFIIVAVMAAVIKSLMLLLSFFLPAEGVGFSQPQPDAFTNTLYRPAAAFGLEKQQASVSTSAGGPVYKLDSMNLKGIYRGSTVAFILIESSGQDIFILKGEQYRGYTLTDILPQKAIFEKSGRRYEVVFKASEPQAFSMTPEAAPVVNSGGFVSVKRKELQYYAKNFDDIWKNIRISEKMQGKTLTGFEVEWIKPDSIFAKIGLQKGDIITGINGKPVSSVSQAFKVYRNLDKIDNLTIEIKRNNQERQLDYAIYE